MIKLLAKIFIKDRDNAQDPKVRNAYGVLASIVGIILNILLFIGKFIAGILSGSIAITADAFNNLSDAGSSFITLIGFKFAGMKPDIDHPFGHGRIEYISGLGVAAVIILMGFELLKSSVSKIISPSTIDVSIVSIVILIVSISVKLYMGIYNRSLGKKINSQAMLATATDSISDSFATTLVLVSMIIYHFTGLYIDGWCGLLVAGFIFFAGYNAAKETISPLLGKAPDKELVDKITSIVLAHEEIVGIHDLIVHDYGPGRLIISLHAEVPGNGDIYVLHECIDIIEKELQEELSSIAVIHMDPIATDDELVTETKMKLVKLIHEYDEVLSIHDFRMVTGVNNTNVIFDLVIPYGYKHEPAEIKQIVEKIITTTWNDYHPVIVVEHSYTNI